MISAAESFTGVAGTGGTDAGAAELAVAGDVAVGGGATATFFGFGGSDIPVAAVATKVLIVGTRIGLFLSLSSSSESTMSSRTGEGSSALFVDGVSGEAFLVVLLLRRLNIF